MVLLFALNTAKLNIALYIFNGNILQFVEVYKWQKIVFSLAIKVYAHIIFLQPSDSAKYVIFRMFQDGFSNPLILPDLTISRSHIKRKQSRFLSGQCVAKPLSGPSNNSKVIWEAFNKS